MDADYVSARPRIRILSDASVAEVVSEIRTRNFRSVLIEGFSGSGKTTLASQVAAALGWRHIEVDELLIEGPIESSRFSDWVDQRKLAAAIAASGAHVIDGVCLRDVLPHEVLNRDPFAIYVARVGSKPGGSYLCYDFLEAEHPGPSLPWLTAAEHEYHRRVGPCSKADAIFLRVEDEQIDDLLTKHKGK